MQIFLIALVSPHVGAWNAVRREWPNRHHIINDTLAMVSPKSGAIFTSSKIEKTIGISTADEDATGIVIPLGDHSGTLPTDAVDWIRAAFNE